MGRSGGSAKLLQGALAQAGIDGARKLSRVARAPHLRRAEPATVITGGAGFLGTNLADRLARQGRHVVVYDSLERANVEKNLAWLRERPGPKLDVEIADTRDAYTLQHARSEEHTSELPSLMRLS